MLRPPTDLFDNVEGFSRVTLSEDHITVVVGLLLEAFGDGHHLVLIQLLEDLNTLQEILVQVPFTDGRMHNDGLYKKQVDQSIRRGEIHPGG